MSKVTKKLLVSLILSTVTLVSIFVYWVLQPPLEVTNLPILISINKPGSYVITKMPVFKLGHFKNE